MSVTSETQNSKKADPPRQSQWALVAREFCKRRLAVAAAAVIFGLVSVSVFAPFLANDRPIFYVGTNRFEFREAARTLRGVLGQISNPNIEAEKAEDLARSVRLQFDLMAAELPSEQLSELNDARTTIEAALAKPDRRQATAELKTAQRDLRPVLESLESQLIVRSHWPVLKSLQWFDLGFMVLLLLTLTFPLWRRWTSTRRSESGPRRTIAVLCLLPALCAGIWWWVVPPRVDRTDYKSGVLAADETAAKAGVVYESVIWPPIVFALDEYDLAGKSAPPAWYPDRWRPKSSRRATDTEAKTGSVWSTPHWMGTDESGRDVLCRMIWGGRVSLSVGIVAVAIYVTIGIIVGALAGYFRGICDLLLSRIIEVVICFPSFFLILTIVAMVGPGLFNIMVVIGLTGWTGIARLVRGEFLRLVDQEFVLAGRALGYSPMRLIFRHVLPNAMAPVLVSATFGVAGAILTESALSFLGLGISKPTPSWGSLLADGREALDHAPWLIHFPGLAIFITITAYNLIGEAMRDASDPRLRGSR
jgi:peptide/nickel transport system permease protein